MLFGTEILHKIHKTTLISTILNFGPLNIITICLYSDKHGSINNPSLSPLCSCFKGSAVCHSWPIHTSSQCHFSPICPPTRTFSFIRIWRCCVHPHCPILRVSSHPYLILCDSSTSQPWSDVLRISMSKMWTKKCVPLFGTGVLFGTANVNNLPVRVQTSQWNRATQVQQNSRFISI